MGRKQSLKSRAGTRTRTRTRTRGKHSSKLAGHADLSRWPTSKEVWRVRGREGRRYRQRFQRRTSVYRDEVEPWLVRPILHCLFSVYFFNSIYTRVYGDPPQRQILFSQRSLVRKKKALLSGLVTIHTGHYHARRLHCRVHREGLIGALMSPTGFTTRED